ncbi:hypothetical protein COP2_025400 [Malus domestica]
MVTASQLQILQSLITALISSVSSSVNVKLDEANYLNWHFQMELLLEGYGIMGFVNGSNPCPVRFSPSVSANTDIESGSSSCNLETDEYKVWKMHDRTIMQLITATLSPIAVSCAIGSSCSKDLWTRLKEHFSTVSKTSVFQLKSDLQNIKKGTSTVSQYLQKIKESRDYLSAAGVHFEDEDIVILALNGLPYEYNTFRCVIRGRENVISLKEFRAQLPAEEAILETNSTPPFLSAMLVDASNKGPSFQASSSQGTNYQGNNNQGTYYHGNNSGQSSFVFKPYNHNKNKGKGKIYQGNKYAYSKSNLPTQTHVLPVPTPGLLGQFPMPAYGGYPGFYISCQLCNQDGHTAPYCNNFQQQFPMPVGQSTSQNPMQAMNTVLSQSSPSVPGMSSYPSNPQVWLTDSGATNHMTSEFGNLSLATPYPSTEMVHTANGEGQGHKEDAIQRSVQ